MDEALQDIDWANSIHEELHQFVRNDVWELVSRPKGVNVIELNGSLRTSQMNTTLLSGINVID